MLGGEPVAEGDHALDVGHHDQGTMVTQRGFGFILPEVRHREGDLFVPEGNLRDAITGDKVRARETMQAAGVPVLPGTGVLESGEHARAAAEEIGTPVILKASAGGGGRGMKIVFDLDEVASTYETASAEAPGTLRRLQAAGWQTEGLRPCCREPDNRPRAQARRLSPGLQMPFADHASTTKPPDLEDMRPCPTDR